MNRFAVAILGLIALAAALVLGTPQPASAAGTGDIVVIGGSGAVSEGVFNHLDSCAPGTVTRIAGQDRYGTAAAVAERWDHAETVFVATGEQFPDAITGGPAAAVDGAPILLVRHNAVTAATRAALERLDPNRIVLLGGTTAISDEVAAELAAIYPEVIRLAGPDRYGTAAAISAWYHPDGSNVAYVASGLTYIDALIAGPRATAGHAPVLLTRPDRLPSATRQELQRLSVDKIVIVGGVGAVGDEVAAELGDIAPTVTRLAGVSKYSTAAAAADEAASGGPVYVVTVDNFPDGLAAIPLANASPILFASLNQLHDVTAAAIGRNLGSVCDGWIPPYPQVGSGKRIIYSNSAQRVWLIDENEQLVDTYLVSGRKGIPHYGTYSVFSKSVNAWAPYGGITMKYMVRFVRPYTWDNQWSYGFHAIPRYSNGEPMQTEDELGTFRSGGCVRQADAKAYALYQWAPIGTTVHAIP